MTKLKPAIFPVHFRSATDFEGGAFRLLSGGGAAAAVASLAEPDAGNTLSPSKREQRRQMAEALLGAEHDAQARQSVSSCSNFQIEWREYHFLSYFYF